MENILSFLYNQGSYLIADNLDIMLFYPPAQGSLIVHTSLGKYLSNLHIQIMEIKNASLHEGLNHHEETTLYFKPHILSPGPSQYIILYKIKPKTC